ncbi:hypothetical protein Sjap_012335 [Stephania japonica]|uniref:ABC transporter domain-containing protein n=1 Tax=Stephania japonica TaxID=461633 RepID=A0AAP0IXJ0_9MAGN
MSAIEFCDQNRSTANGHDEAEAKLFTIERLPTYGRMRRAVLKRETDDGTVRVDEVDVAKLGVDEARRLKELVFRILDEKGNERFLEMIRDRATRVGVAMPEVEVRFENLSIEADEYVGSRAVPNLLNSVLNAGEEMVRLIGFSPSEKRTKSILHYVSGIVKPSRMTLLLGPPASGKSTLLKALAGKLDEELRVNGKITYCGHGLSEFVPQRACSYVSQHDLHYAEMTVRETFDFSGRCLGVGSKYELLAETLRHEKEAGIMPDPVIDAYMKATTIAGKTRLVTDYVIKMLGLEVCSDIIVGDAMTRGISGGQRKRVTTGEMLVGPQRAFFMDGISTGLDSSTTFQIVKFLKEMVHIMDMTMVISLLQPAPETFELFDDVILLSEGHVVYQGPRESVLAFFELVGFNCPERKGVADFLQEVTSKMDQEQYWIRRDEPYRYISAEEFVQHFKSFHSGQQMSKSLNIPYDKNKVHPAALVKEVYGIPNWELLKVCLSREWLLMKRSSFVYLFKITEISIMAIITMSAFFRTTMKHGEVADGAKFHGVLFFSLSNVMFNGMEEIIMIVSKLPVFYKQRDLLFYPSWAFALPICFLRIPISLIESVIWVALTYYTIGFAPAPNRMFRQFLALFGVHLMSLSLYRLVAAIGRTQVVASIIGTCTLLLVFMLGGFVISKDDIPQWMAWSYYLSPMMYGQNAVAINEFLDKRWSTPIDDPVTHETTVGKVLLSSRGMFVQEYWYWICIGALFGFALLFNACFVVALTWLNPIGSKKVVGADEDYENRNKTSGSCEHLTYKATEINSPSKAPISEEIDMEVKATSKGSKSTVNVAENIIKRGMVLPFQSLSMAFNHMNYYVDMPPEMQKQGIEGNRLQLLCDVSGAFKPGVLTALVGVSGAGKTTLMDVLAGRKTGGYIEGSIYISGFPKDQATFARVSGYCEQDDIHSPNVTVYESLLYSAWLRLAPEVKKETRKMFVEEVMTLLELNPLKNALVGQPGVDGLSLEQRKRLTIAVELVANPSIIFMDEPTSGLDARAAAIVMRTVRNTADTGRTVVCTIHQPSIDIFEAFDELILMKQGGQVIYGGPLGRCSQNLVEYFEAIPGVPKIRDGYNPATWMLEVTTPAIEAQLKVNFAEVYTKSATYKRNQELIKELSTPVEGSKDLYFPTKYAQNSTAQFIACFWRQYWSYWRNSQHNVVRFVVTIVISVVFGVIYWDRGNKTSKQQDLLNLLGGIVTAVSTLGPTNATAAQALMIIERATFFRERAAGMYSALPHAFAQASGCRDDILVHSNNIFHCATLRHARLQLARR